MMWPFTRHCSVSDSGILRGMTDYHSHLLPGVDDGVKTPEETLHILSLYAEQGIQSVWLTPHVMEDVPNTTQGLTARFRELASRYRGPVRLNLAAEYMLDNLFESRLEQDDLLPISEEGRNYLLVETSCFNPPIGLEATLGRIRSKGYYPLLAHPERYIYMEREDYRTLNEAGTCFQMNLSALAGMYGKPVQSKAEMLLKAGLYHRVGTDVHSLRYFQVLCGARVKKDLVIDNR